MGLGKFSRIVKRGLAFAGLGTLMLQGFAITYGVVVSLMPDPSYPNSWTKVLYALSIVCPLYFAVGLALFFPIGVSTHQPASVVLGRCARTLSVWLPASALLCAVGGAIYGYGFISKSPTGPNREAGWLLPMTVGVIGSFPIALLAASVYCVVLLRRETD